MKSPPNAMPYMGKIAGYKGAYINAGHNCRGITCSFKDNNRQTLMSSLSLPIR